MLTNSSPFSPDQPELQLLTKRAGIDPSRLARALNDPEHLTTHITAGEILKLTKSYRSITRTRFGRLRKASVEHFALLALVPRMNAAIDIAIAYDQEQKAKGLITNA